ncbi:hypothetical protein DyAD56_12540 [Dyella sp. AD56]|nr:hypothetical protein DyAD56_12540 [Dyella sp. AD56]
MHQLARKAYEIFASLEQRCAQADAAGEGIVEIERGDEGPQRRRLAFTKAGADLRTAIRIGRGELGTVATAHGLLQVACLGHHRDRRHNVQRMRCREETVQRLLPVVEGLFQRTLR